MQSFNLIWLAFLDWFSEGKLDAVRGEKSAGAEAGKLIVNFKQTTNAIKRGAHRQNKKKNAERKEKRKGK